mgnify:CR=1 FL=1
MNSRYQLIRDLLDRIEEYEAERGDQEMELIPFNLWLNRKLSFAQPDFFHHRGEYTDSSSSGVILTMLIGFLFRYAKLYIKKALEDTPLSTLDEFSIMASLGNYESLTKSELIHQNIVEFTSGIEIIKRLVRNGLMEEFADPNDRRSKRVKLTAEGKKAMEIVVPPMNRVAKIVEGDLNPSEMAAIMPILYRLNDFHAVIHHKDKKSSIDVIMEKYVESNPTSEN